MVSRTPVRDRVGYLQRSRTLEDLRHVDDASTSLDRRKGFRHPCDSEIGSALRQTVLRHDWITALQDRDVEAVRFVEPQFLRRVVAGELGPCEPLSLHTGGSEFRALLELGVPLDSNFSSRGLSCGGSSSMFGFPVTAAQHEAGSAAANNGVYAGIVRGSAWRSPRIVAAYQP